MAEKEKTFAQEMEEVIERHLQEMEDEKEQFRETVTPLGILIETEEQADHAVSRIVAVDRQLEDLKLQYQARKKSLEAKRERMEFIFSNALQDFLKANLTGKKKSMKLFSGTLALRNVPGRAVTADEDKLRKWVETEHPEMINYDQAPIMMAELADWEKENGEAPGRIKKDDEERFYIKAAKKEA